MSQVLFLHEWRLQDKAQALPKLSRLHAVHYKVIRLVNLPGKAK